MLTAQQQLRLEQLEGNALHPMPLKGSADYVHHPLCAAADDVRHAICAPTPSAFCSLQGAPSMGVPTQPPIGVDSAAAGAALLRLAKKEQVRFSAVCIDPQQQMERARTSTWLGSSSTTEKNVAIQPKKEQVRSICCCEERINPQQQMEDARTSTWLGNARTSSSTIQTENAAAIQPKKLKLSEEAEAALPKEMRPQEMCDVFDTWDASSLQELGQEIWSEEISSVLDSPSWTQPLSEPSSGAGQGTGQYSLTVFSSTDSQSSASINEESVLLLEERCGKGSPATHAAAVEVQKRLNLAAASPIPKTFIDILPFNTPFNRAFEDSRLERRQEGHQVWLMIMPLLRLVYLLPTLPQFMYLLMETYQDFPAATASGLAVRPLLLSILPSLSACNLAILFVIGTAVLFLSINRHKQDLLWRTVRDCYYVAGLGFRFFSAYNLAPLYFDGTTPCSKLLSAIIYFSFVPIAHKLVLDPHCLWCIVSHHLVPVAIYLCTHSHLPDVYAQSEKYLWALISSTTAVIMLIEYCRRVQFVNRLQAIKLARHTHDVMSLPPKYKQCHV